MSPRPGLCAVQAGYSRSTERADSFILPTLQKAFGPSLDGYEILGDKIIQPNAVGMKLRLPEGGDWPKEVFLKQVLATDYVGARKDWSDLRRTLLYARTELRFYRDVLPIMNKKGFHAAPKAYHCEYDFGGWIDESERATQPADESVDKDDLPNPSEKGGWLILECLSDETHAQDSPLSMDGARRCLEAAAELHASAWEDEGLLRKADAELSRAAFNLRMRNPKELAGIEGAWDDFSSNFRADLEASGLWTNRIRNLGGRLRAAAERVSEEVTPSPGDRYATIIHGDYKAMNVMMGIDASAPTIMIDMASASAGLGMSDVAMHVHHAVNPEDLDDGGEESLLEHYLQTLRNLGCEYPDDVAQRHYRLCVIDYARFFVGRMWKTATPDTMAQKKDNKNIANINRSVPSAMRFVRVVDKYLSEVEESLVMT
eukprot:CAMPEP_0172546714 /NCGR_PEP_ID=MMETSP1067-20121228/16411_1 /TAXON_ID=265564 ORGANISM="Thalassiosira punctigera, Strain Tpunct2005C2" /NCGR_SAMPLE_ID=MMETSP1067 /ASSEMBLY_ACC=CAM_ASM_000444 /LENGTH=428 /DNA_ID=CAMNT_0013333681 /DNA_START=218 /DNA_END=1507 /DNA_ORIENTATION=-